MWLNAQMRFSLSISAFYNLYQFLILKIVDFAYSKNTTIVCRNLVRVFLIVFRIHMYINDMKRNEDSDVAHRSLVGLLNFNKIAQGDINIFSHFNIRNYLPFSRFFSTKPEVTSSIKKNIVRFVFSMSELFDNDKSLSFIGQF